MQDTLLGAGANGGYSVGVSPCLWRLNKVRGPENN